MLFAVIEKSMKLFKNCKKFNGFEARNFVCCLPRKTVVSKRPIKKAPQAYLKFSTVRFAKKLKILQEKFLEKFTKNESSAFEI